MPIENFNSRDRFRSSSQRGAQPQKQYFSQPSRLQFGLNRTVIKSRGSGIFPGYYERGPQLLAKENRRKIEPKEIPSYLIPRLLVVFTQQIHQLWSHPIQSRKWMNVWKSTKVYTWKENIEDGVKLLESKVLNRFLKITMSNLRKIGLKWGNDVSENLAPLRVGPCPSLYYPPPPQESAPLGHIFRLTGQEWSLGCWAKN